MRAASTGSVRAVEALIAHGADVHQADPELGQTPLMWAISAGHPDVAAVLIAQGADVVARSIGGFTPLLFAAREGDAATARSLLAAGADVHDAMENGTSALLLATLRGQAPTAMLLLEHGADPNGANPGYTPLHWAAGSWQTELSGPNGIATGRDDEWRALRGIPGDKVRLVRALLDHGADPDARLESTPPRAGYSQLSVEHRVAGVRPFPGATPFLLAAMAADVEVMRVLAEGGADPNLTADDQTTPLMLAAGLGRYMAEISGHRGRCARGGRARARTRRRRQRGQRERQHRTPRRRLHQVGCGRAAARGARCVARPGQRAGSDASGARRAVPGRKRHDDDALEHRRSAPHARCRHRRGRTPTALTAQPCRSRL